MFSRRIPVKTGPDPQGQPDYKQSEKVEGMQGIESSQDNFEALKTHIHSKLVEKLDLTRLSDLEVSSRLAIGCS